LVPCRDETVEVGAKLYQIDADATATAAAPVSPSTNKPKEESKPKSSEVPAPSHHREPLIHFLGKAGWAARKASSHGVSHESSVVNEEEPPEMFIVESLVPDDPAWNPMYGRPPISEDEMEALLMGGASGAGVPRLVKPSRGAVFA